MKRRMIGLVLALVLACPLAIPEIGLAEEFADQGAFLEDMAAGINDRQSNNTQDTSVMTFEETLVYYNELVTYELDRIEKYDGLIFEDEKFDKLAHAYIDACKMQKFATENERNRDLYNSLWNGALMCRSGIIVEMYERYELPISAAYADDYQNNSYQTTVTYTVEEVTEAPTELPTETPTEAPNDEDADVEEPESVDLEITDARFGWKASDWYYKCYYTVKNCTDDDMNYISLDFVLLDIDGNIVDSGGNSTDVRVHPGQSVTIEGQCDVDIGAVTVYVDGYSYKQGDDHFQGYIDDSPVINLITGEVSMGEQGAESEITAEPTDTPEPEMADTPEVTQAPTAEPEDNTESGKSGAGGTGHGSGTLPTQYEFWNGVTTYVPVKWIAADEDTTKNGSHAFYTEDSLESRRNTLLIASESIKEFMKIDVGNGALTTKEDVAEYYMGMMDATDLIWNSIGNIEYCTGHLATDDGRIGVEVVIPINVNEAAFYAAILCEPENEDYLDDMEVILKNLDIPGVTDRLSETLTIDKFYQNVQETAESLGGSVTELELKGIFYTFDANTDKYGNCKFAAEVDTGRNISIMVIDPSDDPGGMTQDAWSIMAEMSYYIRDVDPNLDAYDADVVFSKSLSGKYVKNGMEYFLDAEDSGLYYVTQLSVQ